MKIAYCIVLMILILDSQCQSVQSEGKWYESLPDCPCRNPDLKGLKIGDGWAVDKGDIGKYHKGATQCFRSYPYTKTSVGKSGQQCCYDKNGLLIKSGSGAGTPDKVSTCDGEGKDGVMTVRAMGVLGHYINDVKPFEKAGTSDNAWKTYNKDWVPNQGKNCN